MGASDCGCEEQPVWRPLKPTAPCLPPRCGNTEMLCSRFRLSLTMPTLLCGHLACKRPGNNLHEIGSVRRRSLGIGVQDFLR